MLKIYLSGTTGEIEYRRYFHDRFDDSSIIKLIDPIEELTKLLFNHNIVVGDVIKTSPIVSNQIKKEIVESDKNGIKNCDILVAYMRKFTAGTLMEIMYSYNINRLTFIINPGLIFKDDIWLSYHVSKMFNTIDDCCKYLIDFELEKNTLT
jgi:nucleoside 2-deoxyribosyltransferase